MWALAMERSSENSTCNSGRAAEVTAGEHESPGCSELKKFRTEGTYSSDTIHGFFGVATFLPGRFLPPSV